MFYQTSGGHSESAAVSKPSALQRIYGYKKAREEQQPQKYKHRPDCYIDKPNNDSNFWKPGGSETETGRSTTTPNKAPSANGSISVKCMEKKRSGKCLAKYTFAGETKMDLEFKEGDTIELLEKVDVDWFKGKIGQKEGLFPAAYVEIIEDIAESAIPAKAEDPGAITALVAFDFKGSKPGDLSLKGGQEVIILSKVDSQWLYGEVDGKRGVFPSLYASIADEEIEELPIHKVSPAAAKENGSKDGVVWATALYDFTAENDSELSLKAGDSVKVTASDNEWSTGEKDGRIGLFPTNFVQLNGPQASSVSH
ncbi:SH3D19 [Bugula neritina]|uniref:SH3D19 n=1 Tax=Bugula neritina TaxID=10212 RepID=A0A7J7KRI8_BUGNE|nr:SH3D19 [Bugula neritina]